MVLMGGGPTLLDSVLMSHYRTPRTVLGGQDNERWDLEDGDSDFPRLFFILFFLFLFFGL